MRTRTTVLLMTLIALASCSPKEPSKNLPVKENTIEPYYEVCSLEDLKGELAKAMPYHLKLNINDQITVKRVDLVTAVEFKLASSPTPDTPESVDMINCCSGQSLVALRPADDPLVESDEEHLLKIVDETELYRGKPLKGCDKFANGEHKRLIAVRVCFATYDQAKTHTWACPGDPLSHGGDAHASGNP